MTKSRTALGLLLALAWVPAAAQPEPAEDLVEAQRSALRSGIRMDCPTAADSDEIIVCGSREQEDRRHRLPLPVARPPGSANLAGGEQRAALDADSSRCTAVGRAQACNGGLDLIGIGFTIARAVATAIARDD